MRVVLVMGAVLALCGCTGVPRCAGPLVPINTTAGAPPGRSGQRTTHRLAHRRAARERARS